MSFSRDLVKLGSFYPGMLNMFTTIAKMSTKKLLSYLLLVASIYVVNSQRIQLPNSASEAPMRFDNPNELTRSQADTLRLLTNLLSYSQQQQQQQQQHPNLNTNRQVIAQSIPVSTPTNPFINGQFQQNRRLQVPQPLGQPVNNFQRNNNEQNLFLPSSSPPTPYLTLNRLNNFANQVSNPRIPMPAIAPQAPHSNEQNNFKISSQRVPDASDPLSQPSRFNNFINQPSSNFPRINNPINEQNPKISTPRPRETPEQTTPPRPNRTQDQTTTIREVKPTEDSNIRTTTQKVPEITTITTTEISPSTQNPTTSSSPVEEKISTQKSIENSEHESGSSWSPVDKNKTFQQNSTLSSSVSLVPSPDIVTVPPGYNPDAPKQDSYDISVSAKMSGGGRNQVGQVPKYSVVASTTEPSLFYASSTLQETTPEAPTISIATVAPTAVTTIIWSPPSSDSSSSIHSTSTLAIQPTKTIEVTTTRTEQTQIQPQATTPTVVNSPRPEVTSQATRIRDNSLLNDEQVPDRNPDSGVVYGKPQSRDSQVVRPPGDSSSGRPYIKPAPLDSQVRPMVSNSNHQQPIMKSNHHSSAPFKPSRPLNGNQVGGNDSLNVGSGFTITSTGNQTMPTGDIQDYVAGQPPPVFGSSAGANQGSGSFQVNHEPTISAHGGQDPSTFDLSAQDSSPVPRPSTNSSSDQNPPASVPRVRRPTFKPKPAEPPIRIDSCIVGDESSCDQSHNERCVTEYGISSCHCKPGFARLSQLRGFCSPISSLQMTLRIDKLSDDRKLSYNYSLESPNSEEYQFMEFETIQALAGAFQQSSLAKQFMGSKVNRFFENKGKVWANVTVNLEANNVTKSNRIQQVVSQELSKIIQGKPGKTLGDSTIVLDGTKESVSRLVDINECSSPELNDCSKQATCTNEFGGFNCQCLPGYEDKHANKEKSKQGRVCLGCSASYCSNRGECSIVDGQKLCKCRPNFIGSRCDIDSEVMAVAIGGSLVGVIILVVTFWCLFVFNRRWKREQQKLDAMSATSGLTYNYVNSSTNSLMSPTRIIGGMGRSGGPQNAANYIRNAAIVGRANHHYLPDQQAIMGSTSSGGSAASQPIGCNPYVSGYQYEDSGLLIAPASTGSSEQTSPNSYRGNGVAHLPGNAYTLSGHHHHNHSHHHHMIQHQVGKGHSNLTQFHPAADYRTMSSQHCLPIGNPYESQAMRWRTMQQDSSKQSAMGGYYLSPDMLMNRQQQVYASPERELCVDTDGNQMVNNRTRRQQGRAATGNGQTLRSRSQGPRPTVGNARNSLYNLNAIDYEHERPI